jgi:hypothetical protein
MEGTEVSAFLKWTDAREAAVRTLQNLHYTHEDGAELWRPPLGSMPNFDPVDQNRKWACKNCDWRGVQSSILRAANPFDAGDIVCGCPQCKSVDSFTEICDEPRCEKEATCGWKPKDAPYRRTCHVHMGEHDYGPST